MNDEATIITAELMRVAQELRIDIEDAERLKALVTSTQDRIFAHIRTGTPITTTNTIGWVLIEVALRAYAHGRDEAHE